MSKLELNSGRIIQKLKTREKLVFKANELLKEGNLTSIEQAAREAGISKATAYRYFTKLDALKREASLQLKAERPEDLFKDLPDHLLDKRLERLINYHFHLFIENEQEFRLFLSSVIGESLHDNHASLRGGRRIALITEALFPLKKTVSKNEFDQMVYALSLVFGIESITILRDLCKLDNNGILENWRWTVAKIVYQNT
jgi:AcrR family transcriptional regulator